MERDIEATTATRTIQAEKRKDHGIGITSRSMRIMPLRSQDKPEFNELAHEHGSIFNTLEWTNIFRDQTRRFGIYNNADELVGGFSLLVENRMGLAAYRNPPFTPEVGPFFLNIAQNPSSRLDFEKEVIDLMSDFTERLPYAVASFSLNKSIVDLQPFLWRQFKVSPVYTYLLDLQDETDKLWKAMSSPRRHNVSRGARDGLLVKRITDFETVRQIVFQTFNRQNKKPHWLYLHRILFEFAGPRNSFAFATFRGDHAIACAFCIHDNHSAYYLLGGHDSEVKHYGAGTMALWECIKHAQSMKLKYFDFEGSMVPQIEKYFRGFGGKLTPFFRVNKARLPLEFVLKLFRRELF